MKKPAKKKTAAKAKPKAARDYLQHDSDTIVVTEPPWDHYYSTDGVTIEGPVWLESIFALVKRGKLPTSTLICREGSSDWAFVNALMPAAKKRIRKGTTAAARAYASRYDSLFTDSGITLRQRANRSLHTLEGLLNGFALDGVYSEAELTELKSWMAENRAVFGKHPFDEIVPRVALAIKAGRFDRDTKEDIVWLCRKLAENSKYYDAITSDLQRLQGTLHGALADDLLSDEEIYALGGWLNENAELQGCFPYDEIVGHLKDIYCREAIEEKEREFLKGFFASFAGLSSYLTSKKIVEIEKLPPRCLTAVCEESPSLEVAGKVFCLTGASAIATRGDMVQIIENLGGMFSSGVVKDLDYLVVGNSGNPAWAYSCYGRKIERALKYQEEGCTLLIVHEHDFWAAVERQAGKPVAALSHPQEKD